MWIPTLGSPDLSSFSQAPPFPTPMFLRPLIFHTKISCEFSETKQFQLFWWGSGMESCSLNPCRGPHTITKTYHKGMLVLGIPTATLLVLQNQCSTEHCVPQLINTVPQWWSTNLRPQGRFIQVSCSPTLKQKRSSNLNVLKVCWLWSGLEIAGGWAWTLMCETFN